MASRSHKPRVMLRSRGKTLKALSSSRWIFVVVVALSTGCTTMTPLQTASTVKRGVWRVGGQGSVSPACSVTDPGGFLRALSPNGNPPFRDCMVSPAGLPTPELRAHARRGLNEAMDVGASVHGSAVFPVGIQLGATGDVRREVWSRPLSGDGRRQILTLGPQLGLALISVSDRSSSAPRPELQTDLTLPLYFGHQLESFELVASPRYNARLNITPSREGGVDVFDTGYLGLTLSAHSRTQLQLAFGLDYFAPTGMLAGGLFTVSLGIAYDLGGS